METKRAFHLKTVLQLRAAVSPAGEAHRSLTSAADSIAHMAPEILDSAWTNIYQVCTMYLMDNKECFDVYTNRYNQYKKQYF